ncbi:MAG TPA: nitrate reductase molybdenum cofactor assembly chaperone [Burkholderiaceae bacterium]|nr:nitrate reductase molybdenum cofactor assembly chaperone [Burkholderiaceae bacterium]
MSAQMQYRPLVALAALLDYPTRTLHANVGLVAETLSDLGPIATRSLQPLLDHLARTDLIDLQETYVDTFDRGRRTCLNLFEHVHGDSRDRGQAMVDLLALYRKAGLELSTEQLPDYLPAFLEYLSLLSPEEAHEHLAEVTHLVRAIGAVLAQRGSPYAGVFDALLRFAGEAPLTAETNAEDDTSFAAIDAAWKDEPVNFLDAPAPCETARRPVEQTIQIHRRPSPAVRGCGLQAAARSPGAEQCSAKPRANPLPPLPEGEGNAAKLGV